MCIVVHSMVDHFIAELMTPPRRLSFVEYGAPHQSCGHGDCGDWHSFVNAEVRHALAFNLVDRVIIATSQNAEGDLGDVAFVCEGVNASEIVHGLLQTSELSLDEDTVFYCGSSEWRIGRCGSEIPSVCVNCMNACTDIGSDDTINCAASNSTTIFIIDLVDIYNSKESDSTGGESTAGLRSQWMWVGLVACITFAFVLWGLYTAWGKFAGEGQRIYPEFKNVQCHDCS